MKAALKYILAFLPLLAFAQDRAVEDITATLVEDGGIYYLVTTTTYEEGPDLVTPTKIGDLAATLAYLQANANNRQQEIAAAQKKVIEEKVLSIREFQGIDTLIQNLTGGDTTLYLLNNNAYYPDLAGRYRIRNGTGSTNFTAQFVQYPNGAVRFQREDNPAVTYPVLIYSPVNFRVLNLVIGALPAAPYDMYEISTSPAGMRTWRDENRIVTIIKIE